MYLDGGPDNVGGKLRRFSEVRMHFRYYVSGMREVCNTKLIEVSYTLFKTSLTGGNRGNRDRV